MAYRRRVDPVVCESCGAELTGPLGEGRGEIRWAVVTVGGPAIPGHQHTWTLCRNCGAQLHNKVVEWLGTEGRRT